MKHPIILLLLVLPLLTYSQTHQNIHTQDVENFWIAYDSIRSTTDKDQQINFINKLYIDKASEGLKAFLKNKQNPDKKWVDLINNDQSFWDNVRPKTLITQARIIKLQNGIDTLQALYPNLKDAATYFIIGFRQQGGTIRNNLSIIGTEVITNTDTAGLTRICIHEYVHTQQVKPDFQKINVLTSSIREGACDFISELVLKQKLTLAYIEYGLRNEVETWRVFTHDMLTSANDLWVSTGDNPILPTRDLGYFVGYAICKSYYNNAKDKKRAVTEIIDLDYTDSIAVTDFLKKSEYEKYIISKGYNPAKKLDNEGYTSTSSQIRFSFPLFDKIITKDEKGNYMIFDIQKDTVKSISIAGDFNNWDYKNSTFQLVKKKKNTYILDIDKSKLGESGTKLKFKFVINNAYWVEPKFAISNRVTDKGNTTLFIQL